MKKLIVHIGYPKTATSTLQKNVLIPLHQHQHLNYLGEETISGMGELHHDSKFVKAIILGEMKETTFSYFRSSDALEYYRRKGIDPSKRLTSSKGFLMPFLKEGMINILSYESLLMPFRAITRWTEFPRKLHDALTTNETDVQIVITLRNQASLMESFFFEKCLHYYLGSEFSSPRHLYFKDNSNLCLRDAEQVNIFDFFVTLSEYEKVFGRNNIHILFYEDIEKNPDDYCASWARILDIPASEFSGMFTGKSKSRVTAYEKDHFKLRISGFDYLLRNKRFSGSPASATSDGTPKKPLAVRIIQACKRLPFASRWTVDVRIPRFSRAEREAIYRHFKNSNSETARRYNLDTTKMKDYGYF